MMISRAGFGSTVAHCNIHACPVRCSAPLSHAAWLTPLERFRKRVTIIAMRMNTPAHCWLQRYILALLALVVLSACDVFAPPTQSAIQPSATSPFGPIIQPDHTPTIPQNSLVPPTQPPTARATLSPTKTLTPRPTATGPTPKFGPIVGPNAVQPASNTPAPGQNTSAPTIQ